MHGESYPTIADAHMQGMCAVPKNKNKQSLICGICAVASHANEAPAHLTQIDKQRA